MTVDLASCLMKPDVELDDVFVDNDGPAGELATFSGTSPAAV